MLHFLVVFTPFIISVMSQDCKPVDFGKGSIVCVCNSTYCDFYDDPNLPKKGEFIWYMTSKNGERLKRFNGKVSIVNSSENRSQISIDSTKQYQTIVGFGGAFTDSAGINIKKLSEGCQNNIMRSYFSNSGNKYNLGRVPIGGTDFSTRPYTYLDSPGDMELKTFKLAPEDFLYKIPYMKQALKLSPSLLFLSAVWTAPPWMKSNKQYNHFGYLLKPYYQVFADYIIKFLAEYKKNGLDIWAVTTGNEPLTPLLPTTQINSMFWSPRAVSDWVMNNLGPSLKNSSFNNIQLLVYEDQRHALYQYISSLKNYYSDVFKYIDGIALHWYTDTYISPRIIDKTHNLVPDKYILLTESCLGSHPWDKPKVILGSWTRAENLINKLFENINHWIIGWVVWNLALDATGGPNWVNNNVDALIIVDEKKDVFYKQPLFYVMAHFSKFVPRSSVRIDTKSADKFILSTAFRTNTNTIVVILYNGSDEKKNVTVTDEIVGNINIELPQRSLHTLLYQNE